MFEWFLVNSEGEKLSDYMKEEVKKDIHTLKRLIKYLPLILMLLFIIGLAIYGYIKARQMI